MTYKSIINYSSPNFLKKRTKSIKKGTAKGTNKKLSKHNNINNINKFIYKIII